MELGRATWRQVEATAGGALLALPLGSLEQHGPHLPLDTDTRIADAVAGGLAARRPGVVVAPPVAYGASGEHAAFAGTLLIGHEPLAAMLVELVRSVHVTWHGVKLGRPDWGETSHAVAFTVEMRRDAILLHAMLNAYWEPLDFELQPAAAGVDGSWRRWIDTALDSPDDIVPWETAPAVPIGPYRVAARSVVVLFVGTTP